MRVTNYIDCINIAYCIMHTMRHYRKNYEIAKSVETSWILFIPKIDSSILYVTQL